MRRLVALVFAACGQASPRAAVTSAPIALAPAADAGVRADAAAAPPPASAGPIALPGCTPSDVEQRTAELDTLAQRAEAEGTDPRGIADELRALLAKPCLRHVRPAITIPAAPTLEHLRQAFDWGVPWALQESLEGLTVAGDKRLQLIPPDLLPELDDKAKRALAPLRCNAPGGSCGPAASFILRAEQAFDAAFAAERASHVPDRTIGRVDPVLPVELCMPPHWEQDELPQTYEAWVSCLAARGPRNLRFADRQLSAPTQGWLVLRGRRGHYAFADEIRAYDLASGAAYVVTSNGALLSRPEDAATFKLDAFTGRVDPAHVREVAFMLLARDAVVPVRTDRFYAVVPDNLSTTLTPDGAYPEASDWGRTWVTSSDETQIAWLFADGKQQRSGDFTWPQSFDWIDTHVVNLVEVMEAGMVRGCAPARLPASDVLRGRSGAVNPLDADPSRLRSVHDDLGRALDGLRKQTCRGIR